MLVDFYRHLPRSSLTSQDFRQGKSMNLDVLMLDFWPKDTGTYCTLARSIKQLQVVEAVTLFHLDLVVRRTTLSASLPAA